MPGDSRPPEMRLFGVTISPAPEAEPPDRDPSPPEKDEAIRKSKSMGNLAAAAAAGGDGDGAGDGYLSDGGLLPSSRKRRRAQERKKAVPWTEEEHRTFLAGLEMLGKGDWRGIAKNFVTTRTPTQVASHAQKYFLRQSNPNKKKRRSSLFDMMSPAPNCPILPPSMAKVHEMVAMTRQLQNSNLDGASCLKTANASPQVVGAFPPVPSPKATTFDSFSKMRDTAGFTTALMPFSAIPRTADGMTPPTLGNSDAVALTFQVNPIMCDTSFLSPLHRPSPLPPPPKAEDPPAEKKDLELTIAPPSQHAMTKISTQNAVGAIGVV